MKRDRTGIRGLAVGIVMAAGLTLAGCGQSSLPAPTTTLPAGTRVGPQVFLSDSGATATAIRDFVQALGSPGSTLTPGQAKAEAPLLQNYLAQVTLGQQRLAAMQVDDARLERQRQAIVGPLGATVVQMAAITAAATAGNTGQVVSRLGALRTDLAALGQAGA